MFKRAGGWLRRGTGWATAGIFLLLSADAAAALSYFPPGPAGAVGLSRPAIAQQFVLGPGESIIGVEMSLDGTPVEPAWDEAGLIKFTPGTALAPGRHTARLSVHVGTGLAGSFYDPVVSEFAFTVSAGALTELPAPGSEELRALEVVNGYRSSLGLASLTYSVNLGAAALSHARYLVVNAGQRALNAHGEQAGRDHFTGATAVERAGHFGYAAGPHEVINFTDRAEVALAGWMDTLYHRIPLIHPGAYAVGYGLAGNGDQRVNVLEAAIRADAPGTVAWPYPGQTGVPTAWDGNEAPDPFALYPGSQKPAGYTISLTFGGGPSALSLHTGALTGPQGDVPVLRFDPGMDSRLTDTVALIPREPLRPGTRYAVAMAGSVMLASGALPFDKRWSFTTAAAERPLMKERVSNTYADGTIGQITVNGSGFGAGLSLFLAGLPVRDLQVSRRSAVTFRAPAGYAGGAGDLLAVTADGWESVWPNFFAGDERAHAPEAGSAFAEIPLLINGRPWAAPALVHRSGAVLVPGDVLEAFGGRRSAIAAIGREYWTVRGATVDYTLGRTAASVGGQPLSLAMPARSSGGRTYVDAGLLAKATGMGVRAAGDRVDVGLLDIAEHWARPQILALVDAGVITGSGDGLFHPDAPISRAAFVKMLIRSIAIVPEPGISAALTDTGSHWGAQQGYIGAALRAGILVARDYPGGRFEPDRTMTREEMAVMIARAVAAAGRPAVVDLHGGAFTDGPGREATRAEAAVLLARSLERH